MAGNTRGPGGARKSKKKGPSGGSGGQRRRGLEGKGPTPKATERTYHPAYKRAQAAKARAEQQQPRVKIPDTGGLELVSGRNAVYEALASGVSARFLYIYQGIDVDERVREIIALAAHNEIEMREVTKPVLDRMLTSVSHQGVILAIEPYEYADLDEILRTSEHTGQAPLIVALDGITDPRNLGAIVRSAAAFGAHAVVLTERRSAPMNSAAWKTSAGAAARLPVAQVTNLTRTLQDLQSRGLFVVGLDGEGDGALADSNLLDGPLVIVVGAEGKGLSRLVGENCDQILAIPIAQVESLNASVAAAIALYEAAAARARRS